MRSSVTSREVQPESGKERHFDLLILAIPTMISISSRRFSPRIRLPSFESLDQLDKVTSLFRTLDESMFEEIFCGRSSERITLKTKCDELSERFREMSAFENWRRVLGNQEEDLRNRASKDELRYFDREDEG